MNGEWVRERENWIGGDKADSRVARQIGLEEERRKSAKKTKMHIIILIKRGRAGVDTHLNAKSEQVGGFVRVSAELLRITR
jgi:hypothetical protein